MTSRVLVAVPGIALAIAVVAVGGIPLAAVLVVVALLGLVELNSMLAAARPIRWAGDLGAVLCIVLPLFGDSRDRQLLLGAIAILLLSGIAGLTAQRREDITLRIAVTAFGPLYLGLPLATLVATRELPHGAGAVANILVGTWAFDTFSFLGGRVWGRTPIAPSISPRKTVEGFAVGLVGGVSAVVIAGLYMSWISAVGSLVLGLAVCLAAYAGDLLESLLKRDAHVKDSGRILLGHGGILDRFDALLLSAPVGYFVTLWLR